MPWISGAIAGGLGLLGSSMTSSAQRQAAETSAQAQLEAARQAAEAGEVPSCWRNDWLWGISVPIRP